MVPPEGLIDLVYRPLFLEMGRILRQAGTGDGPIQGCLDLAANTADPLPSMAALLIWLSGGTASGRPACLRGREECRASLGGLQAGCTVDPSLPAGRWGGRGWIGRGKFSMRCLIGLQDRLFVLSSPGAAEERVFLPEGEGAYYQALDARECAREGRVSRILPPAALEAAMRSCAEAGAI
jgi:hypothetical protein